MPDCGDGDAAVVVASLEDSCHTPSDLSLEGMDSLVVRREVASARIGDGSEVPQRLDDARVVPTRIPPSVSTFSGDRDPDRGEENGNEPFQLLLDSRSRSMAEDK